MRAHEYHRFQFLVILSSLLLLGGVTAIGTDAPLLGYRNEVPNPMDADAGILGDDITVTGNRLAVSNVYPGGGGVTVMERENGAWTVDVPTGIVHDPDPSTEDSWGLAVGLSGDTLAIGAPFDENASGVRTGAVHIYEWNGTGWEHVTNFTGEPESDLGFSVALDDDTLLVGAPLERDAGLSVVGNVHAYKRTPDGWVENTTIYPSTSPNTHEARGFGTSLEYEDNRLIVGAPYNTSAYIFNETSSGWTLNGTLDSPDNSLAGSGGFGFDVSLHGSNALVGSLRWATAYGFERDATGWHLASRLEPPRDEPQLFGRDRESSNFGRSVDLTEDHAIVGAATGDTRSRYGNAFLHDTDTWTREHIIRPPRAYGAHFGWAVEAHEGELFVTDTDATSAGSIYVFGPDTDEDGLSDAHEREVLGSDPLDRDTDGDMFSDYTERFGRISNTTNEYVVRGTSDPTNPFSVPTPVGGVTMTEDPPRDEMPYLDEEGPLPRLD